MLIMIFSRRPRVAAGGRLGPDLRFVPQVGVAVCSDPPLHDDPLHDETNERLWDPTNRDLSAMTEG